MQSGQLVDLRLVVNIGNGFIDAGKKGHGRERGGEGAQRGQDAAKDL